MVVLSLRWGSQAYTLVLAGDDFGFGHGDMRVCGTPWWVC